MFRLALHWQILIAMLVGAVIGVVLNASAGTYTTPTPIKIKDGSFQRHGMPAAAAIKRGTVWIQDTPDQVLLQISEALPGDKKFVTHRVVVRPLLHRPPAEPWPQLPPQQDAAAAIERVEVPTVEQLQDKDLAAYALLMQYGRSPARWVGDLAKKLGDLFLRMLKMVSIPLIVTSLITGVTGLGRAERLGKMFGRTLLYYMGTSLLAIVTGLALVNLIQPGNAPAAQVAAPPGADAPRAAGDVAPPNDHRQREGKGLTTVLFEQIENMIPTNPFLALAEGNFLSIIAFSLAFGVFTILVGGQAAELVSKIAESGFEIIMRMTMAIIHLAPIGVFFFMLSATAGQGLAVFATLGWYMITVALALAVHAMITLPLILKFIARRNPAEFAQAVSPALLTAFSSASSNGTLPLTMTCVEERAGVSNRVTSFVLPLGATINMDGTALYEVVAVLFIAQFTGHDMSLAQQIVVAITALLASVGAAGIPHAGLIMMVIILQAVGLPTETQGLILAVDRVLDMCRTSVNVWSDSCGCAVVSRFEAGD